MKTGVTVNGIEHIEYLPVMDNRNRSIPVENITSMDANKAVQRSITKACARHGVGTHVYAGEDLTFDEIESAKKTEAEIAALNNAKKKLRDLGNQKIKDGVTKEQLWECISARNNGDRNMTTIPSVEICEQIIDDLKKVKPVKNDGGKE